MPCRGQGWLRKPRVQAYALKAAPYAIDGQRRKARAELYALHVATGMPYIVQGLSARINDADSTSILPAGEVLSLAL